MQSLSFHAFSFFSGLKNDNIGLIDLVWANCHGAKRPDIHALTRSVCETVTLELAFALPISHVELVVKKETRVWILFCV